MIKKLAIAAGTVFALPLAACTPNDLTCAEYLEADRNLGLAVRLADDENRLIKTATKNAKTKNDTKEIYRILSRLYDSTRKAVPVQNVADMLDKFYNITLLELDDIKATGNTIHFFRFAEARIARLLLMKLETEEYKWKRAYLNSYKGPSGKNLKHTLKLAKADRHRCRQRGFD